MRELFFDFQASHVCSHLFADRTCGLASGRVISQAGERAIRRAEERTDGLAFQRMNMVLSAGVRTDGRAGWRAGELSNSEVGSVSRETDGMRNSEDVGRNPTNRTARTELPERALRSNPIVMCTDGTDQFCERVGSVGGRVGRRVGKLVPHVGRHSGETLAATCVYSASTTADSVAEGIDTFGKAFAVLQT